LLLSEGEIMAQISDLQLDYDEVGDEVVELRAELRAERIQVQQLLIRLKATESFSHGPSSLPLGHVHRGAEELQRLFLWLAEHADLGSPAVLDVGFEVPIAGRMVHFGRVVQWALPSAPGGKLLLTAPMAHKEPLGNLLVSTRRTGMVDPDAVLHFLHGWDLIAGALMTAAHAHPESSVLITQRSSRDGILIASWPTPGALRASLAHHGNTVPVRLGERVEVHYEGSWYAGILHSVDANGLASVCCDVDSPEVLTIAPLSSVRCLKTTPSTAPLAATSPPASTLETDAIRSLEEHSDNMPATGFAHQWAKVHRRTRSSAL